MKNSTPTKLNFEKRCFRGPLKFAIIKNTRQEKEQNQSFTASKTRFPYVEKLITKTN